MLPDWFDKAVALYNADHSFQSIGKTLGISRKVVSRVLTEQGYAAKYSFKERNGVTREFDVWRKYNVNHYYFSSIDDENKAYWFGFLCADGYVSSTNSCIELSVQSSDIGHLKQFLADLDSDSPIQPTKRILNGKEYTGCRATIYSTQIKDDLIKHGCIPRKSLRLTYPTYEHVPKRLIYPFIRGYIDADGCYYVNTNNNITVEIIGTEHMLRGIIKELNLHTNKIHDLNNDTKLGCYGIMKRINYSGKYASYIINKLYSNATVYLQRKYDKITSVLPSLDKDYRESEDYKSGIKRESGVTTVTRTEGAIKSLNYGDIATA